MEKYSKTPHFVTYRCPMYVIYNTKNAAKNEKSHICVSTLYFGFFPLRSKNLRIHINACWDILYTLFFFLSILVLFCFVAYPQKIQTNRSRQHGYRNNICHSRFTVARNSSKSEVAHGKSHLHWTCPIYEQILRRMKDRHVVNATRALLRTHYFWLEKRILVKKSLQWKACTRHYFEICV